MSEVTRLGLRQVLFALASSTDRTASALTAEVRRALLDFGSETDDNVDATSRVEVTRVKVGSRRESWGIRLTSPPVRLSDVLNAAEGGPIPQEVRLSFPTISQGAWDAILRVA